MRVLGIDTSGYANAVAVVAGGLVLAEGTFAARADSLGKIVTNIDSILKQAGLDLKDVDGFGIGLGPGSWTGIRIGVTVGKILALSTGKPLAGITTLEALAFGGAGAAAQVCPVVSVGTPGTIYAALYRKQDNNIARVSDYYVGDVQSLAGIIESPTVFVSADWQPYRDVILGALASPYLALDMVTAVPDGAIIASLAAGRLECGDDDDPLPLTPLYLKESTARALVRRYPGRTLTGGAGK